MGSKPKKVVLIGLDAASSKLTRKYIEEGKLPNLEKLAKEGVFAENCLSPLPTITPSNWTTIVTGCWPSTHGITDFTVHIPGTPLDDIRLGLSSEFCHAERIYEVAERAGKGSIIYNYPSSWPPTITKGTQVEGNSLEVGTLGHMLPVVFSNQPVGERKTFTGLFVGQFITPVPASGWTEAPDSISPALEVELTIDPAPVRAIVEVASIFKPMMSRLMSEPRTYHGYIYDSEGKGYDRVLVASGKDGRDPLARIGVGEAGPIISDVFTVGDRKEEGHLQFALSELYPDASRITIVVPGVHTDSIHTYPEGLSSDIIERFGSPFLMMSASIVGRDVFHYLLSEQNRWNAEVLTYMMETRDWYMLFNHLHCIDYTAHDAFKQADPLTSDSEEDLLEFGEYVEFSYRSADRYVGKIIKAAPENTLFIIVSDHGATAQPVTFALGNTFGVLIGGIMEEAGYTAYNEPPEAFIRTVDWSNTKAVMQRTCYIYINLKGRDPHGIVDPEDYDELREEIIRFLYDYTDPDTGRKPVALALKKEDARVIGFHGDRVGDIVIAQNSEFGGFEHGPQLPTSEIGMGSMKSLFIMAGPSVKKGYTLNRTMWLQDIVPTICHLTGVPVPAQTEGAIVYQALEA